MEKIKKQITQQVIQFEDNDNSSLLTSLNSMLEKVRINTEKNQNQKESLLNYVKYREIFVTVIDIFSYAICPYILISFTSTMLALAGVSLLSLGLLGSIILNPFFALSLFVLVGAFLTYKHLTKPEDEKNLLEKEIKSDLNELDNTVTVLEQQIRVLTEEFNNIDDLDSCNLLNNKHITNQELEFKSTIAQSTFFAMRSIVSTTGLTASILSSNSIAIPQGIFNGLTSLCNLSIVTKSFMHYTGFNPYYGGIFLIMFIPAKILDYFKYEKKHKNIHDDISINKIYIQHTDLIIKFNEVLEILYNNQKTENHNVYLYENIIEIINNEQKLYSNNISEKLNSIFFNSINFDYSSLNTTQTLKAFALTRINNIKIFFQNDESKNLIKNLNNSIEDKLNRLDALNRLTSLSRRNLSTKIQIDSLNQRINEISKSEIKDIDSFSKEFINLINNNYSNIFDDIESHSLNLNAAVLTYFHYIDNRKLKKFYDIVQAQDAYNARDIANYLPEILHVVEQELNLDIAFKTAQLVASDYKKSDKLALLKS